MQHKMEDILFQEFTVSKHFKLRTIDLLAFTFFTFFCVLMRVSLFPFVSGDYTQFLEKWFHTIKDNGGFSALSISLGDYTPPYFYILAALTYLPIDSLVSIKLVSCIFDFILAITIMKMAYAKYASTSVAILSYGIALITPTILLNSACWAQCDVIYTTFLVLCVFAFMKDKPVLATSFFAIALCFKLQAIFIAPLLVVLWLKGKMKFLHFFLIPAIYIVSIIPSAIAGRNFFELLTIYISQSGQYNKLSMNAPNLYIFISQNTDKMIAMAAILLCLVEVLVAIYILIIKKFELTKDIIISLALFFAILLPFLLPHMHERYFYVADVFSVLYAIYRPKKFYVAVLVIFSSLCSYLPFLFRETPINLNYVALIMLSSLIFLIIDLKNQIFIKN
ncbi:MAG: hypothetical protein WAX04_10835 [Oscillospiraceae bacterium]